jgi:general secretion pathway protein D
MESRISSTVDKVLPLLMSEIRLFVQVFGCTILLLANGKGSLLGQDTAPVDLPTPASSIIGEVPAENLPQANKNGIPVQSLPPPIQVVEDPGTIYNLGPDTNLVRLLDDIRDLSKNGELDSAQSLAGRALEKISRTEENSFYLRQIRKEETQLYFKRANQAMKDKNYSLASQLLARYRENVQDDLEYRRQKREVLLQNQGNQDVSLVGKLVEELDKAKKDLAEIRAKAGLPEDDAKPDFERLMEAEKAKMASAMRRAELLLAKARKDGSDGQYDLAVSQIDEALEILPANVSSIALISDLYKTKQQITWYKMGEAMLKGQVGEVQGFVAEYQQIEEARRETESDTLGIDEETDFDAEMEKARQKQEEQAELAEEMLSRARGDIKKKEYDKANEALFKIKNFLEPNTRTWPVILQASLLKNEINLEKAEDARKEKNWELANQYLDAFRTGFYQDRDIQGDTLTFGRPGLKETKGEKAVEQELNKGTRMEERIKKDKANPYRRDISEFSPEWKDDRESLNELLMRAKVQFINGDLTGATETYRTIETRFSENYEAKEMLRRIAMMRQEESYLGYLKTRQEMLEEIEREWERPKVFDRQIEEVEKVQEGPSKIEEKLKIIQVPGVQFFESPLPEVLTELQRQARAFDLTEPDPAKKGVNIIPLLVEGEDPPNVTITLNSMPLGQMIQFLTETVNWTYDVRADAIVVSKTGGSFRGRPLETEFYEVTQGTINRMTGGGAGAGGGAGGDPFAPAPGGGGGGADDQGAKIKAFLEGAGIPFDETKGQLFQFDGFQMIVTHERRSLDLIERILERLDADSSRQVEIETKFLEVQEGALDEISFDWQFNWGNPRYAVDPSTGNPVIDSTGKPILSFDKTFTGNTRTLATAHSATGMSRDTIISIPDNPDASMNLPNPVPSLPGKIGIGEGVSPLINARSDSISLGGSGGNMILGGSQANLLISALKRKQGTDLLSAPRITVMDGQPAQITIAQEFIYPTDYQPAPAPVVGGGGQGNQGQAGLGGAIQIQSAIPQFDTVAPDDEQPGFREVGVVLDVTPRIEKYNSIALELNPKVTEFDGFIEYGGQQAMIGTSQVGAPPMVIQPSGILMPIFSVRKVNTSVTIFDGATVIIGGLTREEVKTVNDKIPVLGNIPLLGRLFQSSAESYQKRNLLIFVSASIVSRGGSPVREVIQNISPQSIFKDPVIMTPTGTIRRVFKGAGQPAANN